MQFLFSNYTSHFEHLRFMASIDIGGTLDPHGMVLKTQMKLCLRELDFLKKDFIYKNQFARIQTSSIINIEKILNRSITNFYNENGVNVIAAELRLIKTRTTSFCKNIIL